MKRYLSAGLVLLGGWLSGAEASARCMDVESRVAACRIAGQDKSLAICLAGDEAVYRYGLEQGPDELVLRAPLAQLGYYRADGAQGTIDETVVFANGDHAYRARFGFRDGQAPDPTELRKIGELQVQRKGDTVAALTCAADSIERVPELLLDRMRKLGRTHASDAVEFPNYDIEYPGPVAQSPACERDSNVDSCWSQGVSAARGGDPALALGYFDKSCDADLGPQGCYEAGKLYLHNRKLRDYPRAYERLGRVCASDDIGQGPYACKYLGWMHHTGIGAPRDTAQAWTYLSKACFLHNPDLFLDAEGCHFLAEAALAGAPRSERPQRVSGERGQLAYLALAMGCADGAEGICAQARTLLSDARAASAAWVAGCDADAAASPLGDCAGLIAPQADYEANRALRKRILSRFRDASSALDAP
ncbi:sel1 repeat family protein [Lysobacter antibioticus]|uniref:sel1 repeat family protein n=1 Tax=Lysobacter antibioticus TaxID=84531 RepID=UPI000349F608|nr:sel1 repeat family protein [Lysobacter antibioticus]